MDTLELTLFDVESKSSQIWSKLRRNVRALVQLEMCGASQYKPNRPKSTARVFDRGGVFVKACPMLIARTRMQQLKQSQQLQQQSSQRVGALSLIPSCLGISGHPSGSRQGHPRYTGARSAGRPWVARSQFNTAVKEQKHGKHGSGAMSIQGKNVGSKSTVDESLLCYDGPKK